MAAPLAGGGTAGLRPRLVADSLGPEAHVRTVPSVKLPVF